ncbi:MAG: hypothetical protein IH870_02800, partial [Chloroflexi bacterium]|nr:hypothetical protein [Chloroflexota bacterium]
MSKTLLILALLLSVFLIGCSFAGAPASEIESRGFSTLSDAEHAGEAFGPAGGAGAAAPAVAPQMEGFISSQSKSFGDDARIQRGATDAAAAPVSGGGDNTLQLAQRRVISTASISIEVEEVQVASVEVRRIAENLGGF